MDGSTERAWARRVIGWLALVGGLCLASGWLLTSLLGSITVLLAWIVAPVLVLGVAIVLLIEWPSVSLPRSGRSVCALGVTSCLVFLVALFACGDIEGGIPVGMQEFWQGVMVAAVLVAIPLLILGGLLMLLRRPPVQAA